MRISRLLRIIALCGVVLAASACAKRGPDLSQLTADELFARAQAEYQEEDWNQAINLFQLFVDRHLGDPRAPEARMLLGRAHMEKREYITAATHFQRLVSDFPSSPLQLDARFGICEAYHELSPSAPLDQEYTTSAIIHCQSIGEYYPGTEQARVATGYVTELNTKLARKAYDTGLFYYRRRAYDAAVVYFQDVVSRFPQTEVAPEALQQLVQTYGVIGYVEEAQEARDRLLRDYPDSPQAQALRAETGGQPSATAGDSGAPGGLAAGR